MHTEKAIARQRHGYNRKKQAETVADRKRDIETVRGRVAEAERGKEA